MKVKTLTVYKLDKNDHLCVTTHEFTDDSISFHCSGFNIEMSAEQAGQVGAELTAASIFIEGREETRCVIADAHTKHGMETAG